MEINHGVFRFSFSDLKEEIGEIEEKNECKYSHSREKFKTVFLDNVKRFDLKTIADSELKEEKKGLDTPSTHPTGPSFFVISEEKDDNKEYDLKSCIKKPSLNDEINEVSSQSPQKHQVKKLEHLLKVRFNDESLIMVQEIPTRQKLNECKVCDLWYHKTDIQIFERCHNKKVKQYKRRHPGLSDQDVLKELGYKESHLYFEKHPEELVSPKRKRLIRCSSAWSSSSSSSSSSTCTSPEPSDATTHPIFL